MQCIRGEKKNPNCFTKQMIVALADCLECLELEWICGWEQSPWHFAHESSVMCVSLNWKWVNMWRQKAYWRNIQNIFCCGNDAFEMLVTIHRKLMLRRLCGFLVFWTQLRDFGRKLTQDSRGNDSYKFREQGQWESVRFDQTVKTQFYCWPN